MRRPPRLEGRVWIESEPSIAAVDLANAAYGLMLRLIAYAYAVAAPHPDKALAVGWGIGLMRAITSLGEHAATPQLPLLVKKMNECPQHRTVVVALTVGPVRCRVSRGRRPG
jgi:hypothetical protein